MDKKQIYIAIVVLLALGWAVTIGSYEGKLAQIRDNQSGAQAIKTEEEAFAVCDDTTDPNDERACVEQLVRFSNLLKKYEAKLQQLNIQG